MTSTNARLSKLEQKIGEQREVTTIEVVYVDTDTGEVDTRLQPPVTVRDDAGALIQVRWPADGSDATG